MYLIITPTCSLSSNELLSVLRHVAPALVAVVSRLSQWRLLLWYILPPRRPSSSICSSLTTTKSRASSHSRASRRCCWRRRHHHHRRHRHFSCDAAFFLFGTITSATPMTATTFRRKKVSLMTHEETKWQTIKITKTLTTFSFSTPATSRRAKKR